MTKIEKKATHTKKKKKTTKYEKKKKDKHPHFVFFFSTTTFRTKRAVVDRSMWWEGREGIHDDDNYQLQKLRWDREEKKKINEKTKAAMHAGERGGNYSNAR